MDSNEGNDKNGGRGNAISGTSSIDAEASDLLIIEHQR